MKVNLPITQHEVQLQDAHSIVTKTDLKGNITFVNPDFVEISGYSEDELLGKNHNIVRHPDMPPAAFEDLWRTIQAGRPWVGIVKNRCKNGDYYWVEANITPMAEQGELVGYISVRKKPTREQIANAEALYQKLNVGQKIQQSMWDKVAHFKQNLSIKAAMLFTLSITLITYLLLSVVGLKGIMDTHDAMESLYQERLIPLQQLKTLSDLYAITIVDSANKARAGSLSWDQAATNVSTALTESAKQWKAFRRAELLPEEQQLITETELLLNKANATSASLQNILHSHDQARLANLVDHELYPSIEPLETKISALEALQIRVSAELNNMVDQDFIWHSSGTVFLSLSGILLMVFLGYTLYQSLIPRIHFIAAHLINNAIEYTNAPLPAFNVTDELTELVDAYRALMVRMAYSQAETLGGIARIKTALDHSSVAVTLSNENNRLIYMNQAAEKLWGELAVDIAEYYPGFSVERMMGTPVGQYLQDAADRENFSAALAAPKKLKTEMGKRHLELELMPVYDKQGKYTGKMTQWVDRTAELLAEQKVAELIKNTIQGDLTKRLDAASLPSGFLRDISAGINHVLEAVVEPLNMAAEYVDKLSKGIIPPTINTEYQGDFNIIKNNLNACGLAINALVADASLLAVAAEQGDLAVRADVNQHLGEYRKVIEGLNATLDAIVQPLNMAASSVANIARGKIPAPITQRYNGDFNNLSSV